MERRRKDEREKREAKEGIIEEEMKRGRREY